LGSAEVLALLKNTITVLSLNIQRLIRARLYRFSMRFIHHSPCNRIPGLSCCPKVFGNSIIF
jgi:hypothetical protein